MNTQARADNSTNTKNTNGSTSKGSGDSYSPIKAQGPNRKWTFGILAILALGGTALVAYNLVSAPSQ